MSGTVTDGRVARGQRTRAAIVAAFLDLLTEGVPRPTARDIAARAGVSVRSIFQHFEDLEALRSDVVRMQRARIWPMLDDLDDQGDLDTRIASLVALRRQFYEHIAPLRRSMVGLVRTGAIEAGLAELHDRLLRQLSTQFALELKALPRARSTAVLSAADALTSFESWDQLRSVQGLSPDRAAQVLDVALAHLLT